MGNLLTSCAVITVSDKESPLILGNPKFRHCVQNTTAFFSGLSQTIKSFGRICPSLKPYVTLRNTLIILRTELIALSQIPLLEDHRFLAARDCLFNTFAATLRNWWPHSQSRN